MTDAVGIAELIRDGQVSTREVVNDAYSAIESRNSPINAIVTLFEEPYTRSREGAPFAGVPIVLKDFGGSLRGLPEYMGNRALRRLDRRAPVDGELPSRLLDLGFVVVGKSNTPEFGMATTTQPLSFGPTKNPWDELLSPGGSSGGSAAAVAAGLVSIAHGGDLGGSIRIPAAWCGLFGLKPTTAPFSSDARPQAAGFVITKSLRDCGAVLFALRPETGPTDSWAPDRTRHLKVGLVTELAEQMVAPSCRDAAHAAAHAMAGMGHDVFECPPDFLVYPGSAEMHMRVGDSAALAYCRMLNRLLGRDPTIEDAESVLLLRAERARDLTADTIAQARTWQVDTSRTIVTKFAEMGLDVLISPTTPSMPLTLEEFTPRPDDPLAVVPKYRATSAFTAPWNWAGFPALAIPWPIPGSRLPAGVQLVARRGEDRLLLAIARDLGVTNADLPD